MIEGLKNTWQTLAAGILLGAMAVIFATRGNTGVATWMAFLSGFDIGLGIVLTLSFRAMQSAQDLIDAQSDLLAEITKMPSRQFGGRNDDARNPGRRKKG